MGRLAAIQEAKVLVVGAGGIGCELLKTLTLSGFEHIHVVDMDTIEVSNLNRQFLFRKRHVGLSKAKVARDALSKFRPNAKIVAHHANVKSPQFGVEFFQDFSLVLNGLDNLDARRHVNRMCLAAHVPLVESGTTGYLGQVSVHLNTTSKRTECYECQPKPAPKSYPVCTITSTPSKEGTRVHKLYRSNYQSVKPVHCVVWAKDLAFIKLFGDKSQASDLDIRVHSDDQVGMEDAGVSFFEPLKNESSSAYAVRIFDRLFGQNVAIALENEEAWKERRKPTPLFLADAFKLTVGSHREEAAVEPVVSGKVGGAVSAMAELGLNNPQQIWSVSTNAKVFLETVRLYLDVRTTEVGKLTFDKDDQLAVEFVTSAANLRAHSFGIPMQSLFRAKGIAGNIVHAIATTNAIVAGLIVLESMKILSQDLDACRMTYCLEHPSKNLLLMPVEPFERNSSCYVCSQTPLILEINTSTATLRDVVDKIVMRQIGATSPMILAESNIVYETGDDLDEVEVAHFEKNLGKQLLSFPTPIVNGTVFFVVDLQQDFRCSIHVKHRETFSEEEADGMVLHRLGSEASLLVAEQAEVTSQSKTVEGDFIELLNPNGTTGIKKRQVKDVEIGDLTKKVRI